MEITLELEDSDLIVDFDPEFDVAINCVDIEKVQWQFQDGNHSPIVADVFSFATEGRSTTTYIYPDL